MSSCTVEWKEVRIKAPHHFALLVCGPRDAERRTPPRLPQLRS
jgi:hypothetical protein